MRGTLSVEGPSASVGACPTQSVAGSCQSAAVNGGAVTTTVTVPPGHYLLWVDSEGSPDAYTLTVDLEGAPGETCSSAAPLTFTDGWGGGLANIERAFDDLQTTCGATDSRDLVQAITLPGPAYVQGYATDASASNSTFMAALALKSATQCGGATDLVCVAASTYKASLTLPKQRLSAGDYFLVVEGVTSATGGVSTAVQVIPIEGSGTPGDSCASPGELVFVNGTATVSASTLGTPYSHAQGPCGGEGKDHVFRFTTTTTTNLAATLSADLVGGLGAPTLFLRSGYTCSAATNVPNACTAGAFSSGTTLNVNALPAGTYWLWVDSYYPSSAGGGYTLQVKLD
jgi:hypothetical protein